MIQNFITHAAPLIGIGIATAVFSLMGFPLLLGLAMAFKWVKYREWLAIVAVMWSMALLAGSGNYLYNLIYWTTSRFSPALNVLSCVLTFASPVFLCALVLTHSPRRIAWSIGLLVLAGAAVFAMYSQMEERKARDAEAYRQGMKPLSPRTGTPLVRWWRDDHRRTPRFFLQGHVPSGTPLALLTDPFAYTFQPQFCTAVASDYWPAVPDPAEQGNMTEIKGLEGCDQQWAQGLAVLERPVASYRNIAFQPLAAAPDAHVLAHAMARPKLGELGYDPANFDMAKAEFRQALGPRQTAVFITALQPVRRTPDMYPCTGPVLLLSVRDPGNVQAAFPYCAVRWNLFAVDDDLYFAAITQRPTPPGEELAMNPDQTYWLLRVDSGELKQLWPPS